MKLEYKVNGKTVREDLKGRLWVQEGYAPIFKRVKFYGGDLSSVYFRGKHIVPVGIYEPQRAEDIQRKQNFDTSWKDKPRECKTCGVMKEASEFAKSDLKECKKCNSKKACERQKKKAHST